MNQVLGLIDGPRSDRADNVRDSLCDAAHGVSERFAHRRDRVAEGLDAAFDGIADTANQSADGETVVSGQWLWQGNVRGDESLARCCKPGGNIVGGGLVYRFILFHDEVFHKDLSRRVRQSPNGVNHSDAILIVAIGHDDRFSVGRRSNRYLREKITEVLRRGQIAHVRGGESGRVLRTLGRDLGIYRPELRHGQVVLGEFLLHRGDIGRRKFQDRSVYLGLGCGLSRSRVSGRSNRVAGNNSRFIRSNRRFSGRIRRAHGFSPKLKFDFCRPQALVINGPA